MRYKLRTLLIVIALLPPLIGVLWPLGLMVYRKLRPEQTQLVVMDEVEILPDLPDYMYVWPDGSVRQKPPQKDLSNP